MIFCYPNHNQEILFSYYKLISSHFFTSDNCFHITQPKRKVIPKCDVSFANGELDWVKVKVNHSTYIVPCMVQTTLKHLGMDHTVFNLQKTPCLPLPHKHLPNGASTECGGEHLIAVHYSFIDPER